MSLSSPRPLVCPPVLSAPPHTISKKLGVKLASRPSNATARPRGTRPTPCKASQPLSAARRWALLGRLSSGRSSVLIRTLDNRPPEAANPRPVRAAVSLVQRRQTRLHVEDGNPTSPVTVNGSFAAQLHKLSERFISRRSHIEFAALARFGNDRIKNLPHVKRLSPIAAQEGENRLPPTLPRRVILPVGFRGLDGLWRSRPYRCLRGWSPASRRCCQD
jgi:hypothetical protein